MKPTLLTQKLARREHIPAAVAADQLQTMVDDILEKVRCEGHATLPGLGSFRTAPHARVQFRAETKRKRK